jgi:hypothetical protein
MSAQRRRVAALPRLPILVVVAAVLLGAALIGHSSGSTAVPAPPAPVAALSAPVGSESSAWYCVGGTGQSGGASDATLDLVNRGAAAVSGSEVVISDSGTTATVPISVPARSQVTETPSVALSGSWLAATVDLDGGGVTVSQSVNGADGWAESPCVSTTSPHWYFASGSTGAGSSLDLSLFNPTTTTAVVDLSFVTSVQGLTQPQPFQGIVVEPGALVVEPVGAYVQNEPAVATIATARSGRIVASMLEQTSDNGVSGISLRPGVPAPAADWAFPRSYDVTSGSTVFDIFNPSPYPERVQVDTRLASGPLTPFVQSVPGYSTWALSTTGQTRVPANADFATTISASGAGVVVDRVTSAPSTGAAPQWGSVTGVATGVPTPHTWVLPAPGTSADPATAGAAVASVDLLNPSAQKVTVAISALTPGADTPLAGLSSIVLTPYSFEVVESTALTPAGTNPLVVSASADVAVAQDLSPSAFAGIVSLPGIP